MTESLCHSCMKHIALEDATACPYCRASLPYVAMNSLDLQPGHVLQDRYVIGRLLGRGGFGATYIAFDQFTQDRCAVKEYFPNQMVSRNAGAPEVTILKPNDFEFYRQRFFAEATQLRNLSHIEGLARLYDVFSENKTAYFVMEYISGPNLKTYLRDYREGLPQSQAIDILSQLLGILSSVHSSGVLHRDISLDNICLMEDGRIKLIDFGSARSSIKSSMTTFTKGVYTAPEQALGRAQGQFTDLYAVGVVMFELFMGRTPIVQDGNLEPMTEDEKGALVQINRVYLKATKTLAAQRYQLAQDMRSDLLQIEPVDSKLLSKARQKKAKQGKQRFMARRKKKAKSPKFAVNTYKKRGRAKKQAFAVSQASMPSQPRPHRQSKPAQIALAAVLLILSLLFLVLFAIIILS